MIDEWYEDVPTTKKVLMRHCAASDCERGFEVTYYLRIYCSEACRKSEWVRRHRKKVGERAFHGELDGN